MTIKRVVCFLLFFILAMMSVSCQNDVNIIWPEERDKDTVSITMTPQFDHGREGYLYPGEIVTFDSQSGGMNRVLDDTRTVVWTFTKTSDRDTIIDYVSTGGGITSVEKEFHHEGTYKIHADLYDAEDFKSFGVGAPLIDTDEIEITVEAIDFEIATEVIDERVIEFKPKILNPEIGPVYTGLRMHFGDNTVEVFEGTNPESITHSYTAEGIYIVSAELIYKSIDNNSVIAKSDSSVRIKGSLYIVAPSGPLKTDTVYTFQAHQVKKLPSSSAYEWDFGDGTVAKIPYTNEVSHLFIKPGSYVVSVDVLDSEVMGENILDSTYLSIEVEESAIFLDELHQMNKFDLEFSVNHDYSDNKYGIFTWEWDSPGELTWEGTHFSMEWSQDRHSEHLMGRVSEDGTEIEHLIIRHEFVDNDRAQTIQWYELIIHDLPLSADEAPDRFIAHERGLDLNDFVAYFNTYKTEGYHWTEDADLIITLDKE